MNVIVTPGTGFLNLSPEAFHLWATHYLKCKNDFQSPKEKTMDIEFDFP